MKEASIIDILKASVTQLFSTMKENTTTARFFILIHTSITLQFKASATFVLMFTFDPITLLQPIFFTWEINRRVLLLLTAQLHWSI